MRRPRLIILSGPPGSGKTTWRNKFVPPTYKVVSPDEKLYNEPGIDSSYEWSPSRCADAWKDSWVSFGLALRSESDIVFDACLLTSIARDPVGCLGISFDYAIEMHFFIASRETLVSTNMARHPARRLPTHRLDEMIAAYRYDGSGIHHIRRG